MQNAPEVAIAAIADDPHAIRTTAGLEKLAEIVSLGVRKSRYRDTTRHLFFDDLELGRPHQDEDVPLAVFVGETGEFGVDVSTVEREKWFMFTHICVSALSRSILFTCMQPLAHSR